MDTLNKPLAPDWKERAEATIGVPRKELAYTKTPEFRAELRRQAELLRNAPEEQEALDFIEAVLDTTDWDAEIDKE
jgi:hypothetical protein